MHLDADGEVVDAVPSGPTDDADPFPDTAGLDAPAGPVTVGSVDGGGPRYRLVAVRAPDGGTLVAAMPLTDLDATVADATDILVLAGLGALAAAAVIVWVAVRRTFRPIDSMIGTAERIADGDLTERAAVPHPSSEVGHLGTALNTMLDRIETAVTAKTESEARMRRFAADASHELRTPLTSIRGYAELYHQGATDPDAVGLGMQRIEHEAERMSTLVEDLLLLARLDQGRALAAEPVDLAQLIHGAIAEVRALDPHRAIATQLPSRAVFIEGDRERLRQVLDNLLANASEHAGPDASVTISLQADDRSATLVVADTGLGMSADDAAHVFDRFWQAEPTDTHPRRGSGLGLAIVHDLVASHGGTITLATAPGEGARFTITIPLSDDATNCPS